MNPCFRLTRHYTVTSLVAFGVVAATLMVFEHRQSSFFQDVQSSEAQMLSRIQGDFVTRADAVARRDLLTLNEQGNVNLTRLLSNALWTSNLTPYMTEIASVDFAPCRAMPDAVDAQGTSGPTPEKAACFKQTGAKLQTLGSFAPLDARVREVMRGSTIDKINVYDLSGIAVYSTESAQMGEDKSGNAVWKSAARDGKAMSELAFRDPVSALGGMVENRDLVASYLPVTAPGSQKTVGVFEVQADVTPFLARIKATSDELRQVAQTNEARLADQAAANQRKVQSSSNQQLAIVAGLLTLLCCVLLSIVRRAQTVIERQARESDATKQRLAQSEKMTSLGQMVAGVAHQLNTPLAFSKNNVLMSIQALDQLEGAVHRQIRHATCHADIVCESDTVLEPVDEERQTRDLAAAMLEVREAREMLRDVLMGMGQMNELVDNLRSFSRLDRGHTARVNLNVALGSVCYIAKTVISTKITLERAFQSLPAIGCNVSQLNQVFLNLINNAAQAIEGTGTVTVSTQTDGRHITVSVRDTGRGIPADVLPRIFEAYFTTKPDGEGTGLGLAIARNIVEEHGGDIQVSTELGLGTEFRVRLPIDKAARP
ncbi:MAG: HAMP domain-containing sensor histidine kinase [Hydrogenophaga sp.]|uniref:sensor histidine kinase n=1 Tax=Hydrogenophaga sp. TaxID=1904254 RepID=UPI002ABB15FB|nr:HAMP domain-containing sensor histidine kinase [Hydrogenophaga sp.]MDZ4102010.1 HAMP domain-containing sensor histidine kinase [Hydrogenophaga sp.]